MENIENIKLKSRIFPYSKNQTILSKLQIDQNSLHYISYHKDAMDITNIICSQLELIGYNPKKCIITDTTAGVGGDTLSFSKHFKYINAIEIDKVRTSYLKNNINAYGFTNVKIYNNNCLKILPKLNQDVIFIDPPWGGRSYKDFKRLKLSLSGKSLEEICNMFLENVKMIVLKIPLNYDLEFIYYTVKSKRMYVYELKRMFILVILNDTVKIKIK